MTEASHRERFQTLVAEFGPALRRLCAAYERNEASRHDLEQEILLNLWRALPGYRGDASLRTWVYRVAHNVASRHVRRAVKRPKTEGDDQRLARHAATELTPDEAVVKADARARLRECVKQLRPLDRQLILLFFEDVPQGEIGQITGLSQANVSTRIHRIKAELTRMMKT